MVKLGCLRILPLHDQGFDNTGSYGACTAPALRRTQQCLRPRKMVTACSAAIQEHSFSSAASGFSDPGGLKALSFSATTPGEHGDLHSTIKAVKRPSGQQSRPARDPQPMDASVQLHEAGLKELSQSAELTVEESAGSSVSPAKCQ